MKELICIVCPMGCHLRVDENNGYAVTGNSCPRGAAYGKKELTAPARVVTSTAAIEGGIYPCLPVKTNGEVPKALVRRAAAALNGVCAHAPVRCGDIILHNVCGTGVDFVATRDMVRVSQMP